ncbi:DNA polymerase III subunit gamma and tau [Kocuria coralli]|uniref:DNA polymerase III subunit gamma/tau n=1 Tax=Kocuria coralli TaxID=1461025 RepID=A0A5J5KZM9_9MICC|nr:DNA polymerase III subunit gamma and tau [Kocuria coralli]KAA9394375.1 DNA polymerase III subunit gamma and tau [Kocuria coralli]
MTTALYRRYRPETFQDVIGQSHVTDPLMTALRKNKVNHAYLFSGPRGCGKTTSARILARCLNCAEGPTPNPCGHCESCVDLSRGGAGSLDVIEMDAASHGGVDDARQLRERATFAPVRDRYKIFIIDEAHMVTRDGFNALLKIVEEPPEHIKFIFATTEPNKVLPTIRSRTHHYPFRLVPPEPLMDYLQQLCDQESMGVEPGVLAMVVRAGGGSVRDSLSVLDQLMAGTDSADVGYDLAVALLGYTHGALLDDVVDAFASGDAATVFRAVDRVIQTGQDPRRFVEDLLERFRDLVIVDAVPESAANILHGMPEDQIARLRNQAQLMGAAELSRAADITNEALTEMTGATSPQLHLELLCARLLLPSAENSTRGAGARIDRLERRLNMGRTGAPTGPLVGLPTSPASGDDGSGSSPDSAPARPGRTPPDEPPAAAPPAPETATPETAAEQPAAARPAGRDPSDHRERSTPRTTAAAGPQGPPAADRQDPVTAQDASARSRRTDARQQDPSREQSAGREEQEPPAPHADAATAQGPASGGGIDMIRGSWTEIVTALADIHRVSWMTVMRGTPVAFDGSVLQLVFDAAGDRKNFPRFEANLVQAIQQVLGVSCRVEAVGPGGPGGNGASGDSGNPGGGGRGPSGPHGDRGRPADRAPQAQRPSGQSDRAQRDTGSRPTAGAAGARDTPHQAGSPSGQAPASRREAGPRPTGASSAGASSQTTPAPAPDDDSAPVDSWTVAAIPSGEAAGTDAVPGAPAQDGGEPAPPPRAGASPERQEAPRGRDGSAGSQRSNDRTDDSAGPANDAPQDDSDRPGQENRKPAGAGQTRDAQSREGQVREGQPGAGRSGTAPARTGRAGAARTGAARTGRVRTADTDAVDVPEPPASPYDDIPWSDEPPPEDEPPVEDFYGQGRPRRGATMPQAPASQAGPASRAPAPNPPSAGHQGPAGAATEATPEAADDGLPPEQWRPSRKAQTADGATERPRADTPTAAPEPSGATPADPGADAGAPAQRTGRRPSFRERHAARIAAAQSDSVPATTATPPEAGTDEDFVPSDDDVAVENSGLHGRAMIEKVLGGRLLEEHPFEPRL